MNYKNKNIRKIILLKNKKINYRQMILKENNYYNKYTCN